MKMELWCSRWHRNLWAVEGFGLYRDGSQDKVWALKWHDGMYFSTGSLYCCVEDRKWKSLSCVWLFATPWNSPSQNTGVGSLSLLQGIFPTQGSNPGLLHCRILYQLTYQGNQLKDRSNHLGERGWYLTIDMLRREQPVRLTDNYDIGYKEGSQTLLSGFGLRNERDEVIAWDGADEEGRGVVLYKC